MSQKRVIFNERMMSAQKKKTRNIFNKNDPAQTIQPKRKQDVIETSKRRLFTVNTQKGYKTKLVVEDLRNPSAKLQREDLFPTIFYIKLFFPFNQTIVQKGGSSLCDGVHVVYMEQHIILLTTL